MTRRPVPYGHLSGKEQEALIIRAFGTSNPALRAENDRRAAERDRAYREQYGLPPARWDVELPDMNPAEARKHIELAQSKSVNWPIAAE